MAQLKLCLFETKVKKNKRHSFTCAKKVEKKNLVHLLSKLKLCRKIVLDSSCAETMPRCTKLCLNLCRNYAELYQVVSQVVPKLFEGVPNL